MFVKVCVIDVWAQECQWNVFPQTLITQVKSSPASLSAYDLLASLKSARSACAATPRSLFTRVKTLPTPCPGFELYFTPQTGLNPAPAIVLDLKTQQQIKKKQRFPWLDSLSVSSMFECVKKKKHQEGKKVIKSVWSKTSAHSVSLGLSRHFFPLLMVPGAQYSGVFLATGSWLISDSHPRPQWCCAVY